MLRIPTKFGWSIGTCNHASLYFQRFCSNLAEETSIEKPKEKYSDYKDSDIPTILATAKESPQIDNAFKALRALAQYQKQHNSIKISNMEADGNFDCVLKPILKNSHNRPIGDIISAVSNLRDLGVPPDSHMMNILLGRLDRVIDAKVVITVLPFGQSLLDDLLWNIRKGSVRDLLKVLVFVKSLPESPQQKTLLGNAVENIERRWSQIWVPQDFGICYRNSQLFSKEFLSQLHNKTCAHVDSMNPNGLSSIFCSLAKANQRPTPLLNTLSFNIFKSNATLPVKYAMGVMKAAQVLNFPDRSLLEKITSDVLHRQNELQRHNLTAFIYAIGLLRWKDVPLLNAICQVYEERPFQVKELICLVNTLARLHYIPENIDRIVEEVSKIIETKNIPSNTVIDVVWSLTALKKVQMEQIERVLHPNFLGTFNYTEKIGLIKKLQNIDAVASMNNTYKGPRLTLPDAFQLNESKTQDEINLHVYVSKVLENFAPSPKHSRFNVDTGLGFKVDAELVFKNEKPLSLTDYSDDFGRTAPPKSLPEDAKKIAVMIFNFKDYCIGGYDLAGRNVLAVDLLESKGYRVLQVPHFDINSSDKLTVAVQYFEQRIQELT